MKKSISYRKSQARKLRKFSIRAKISGTSEKPRISVFRSNKNIYAQIIDDESGVTLASMSTIAKGFEIDSSKKKTEIGFQIGLELGKKAIEKGIKKVCFDRAGYLYHGRVKALADGARKAGLDF
ncbi:MAG: 50S ribosomal protein L18 [Candidatus Cloacimonadota bacterium]|nr:50S ribosomal protein L18 [Candidatus Cloacimonadota bacterium]